jgi:acyl dehydratase
MAKPYKVGDTFRHARECDPYRPLYYAGASGDFNPIHIDAEAGRMAGLGGTILQGLCTMAWAVEAAVGYAGDPGRIKKIKVRFTRPVAAGDTVTFEGRITRVEGGRAVAELSAQNQRAEDVLRGAEVELGD